MQTWKIIAAACGCGLAIVVGTVAFDRAANAPRPAPRILNPPPMVATAPEPVAPPPVAPPPPAAAPKAPSPAPRPRDDGRMVETRRRRPAHAGMSDEAKREMQASYQRAQRAFDVGDYDAAIAAYKEVYLLGGDAPMLYNMAQAYRLAKRPEQALMYYRRYLSRAPSAPNAADVRAKIAALQEQGTNTASR